MSNTEVMKQSAVKLAGKHPKNKIHRTAGDIAFDVFLYILFVAFTILCVFAYYYLFINTISTNDAVAGGLVTFWPVAIHFQHFAGTNFAVRLMDFHQLIVGHAADAFHQHQRANDLFNRMVLFEHQPSPPSSISAAH